MLYWYKMYGQMDEVIGLANLFDYLKWRGDLSFDQAPFNDVDNLILSCLGYVVLDELVSGFDCCYTTTVAEAASLFVQLPESVKNLRNAKDEDVLVEMAKTKRFSQLQLMYHVDQIDRVNEKQFAAITVDLGNGSYYVVYRGTDHSVIGWKEDFNMTFSSAVPAQLEAVAYLQKVADRTEGPLYVGGHSKGGNLAIYAAAHVSPEVQNRIQVVYNNDGPGFQQEVVDGAGYQAICHRIRTFIPQTSLFGLMLEHAEPYMVIESTGIFVMQHDPYTWSVMGPEFIYLEKVTASGRFMDQTLHNWLAELTPKQREQFVDAVYEAISADEAVKIQDLAKSWLTNTGDMLKALRDVDDDTADMIRNILKQLLQNMGRTVQMMIKEEQEERMVPIKELMEQKLNEKSNEKRNEALNEKFRERTGNKHEWLKLPEQKQEATHHVIGRHKK